MSVGELKVCTEAAVKFRKWMVTIFPDSFPEGEKTDFSLVFEIAKDLIIKYINLKSLMEE